MLALASAPLACASSRQPPPARPGPAAAPTAATPDLVAMPPSDNPVVVLRLFFRTGSIDDPAGREGLTALTARWMAEGGTRELDAAALRARLFPMAGDLSVQVDKEAAVFIGRVHRDKVDELVPLLLDVVRAPRWDAKEFRRLRADALDSVTKDLRSDNDEELGKQALQALLFEGHPYGHHVAGTAEGLRASTAEECRAHAARVFGRARLTVGVAGGHPAGLGERVAAALAALPPGEPPRAELPQPQDSRVQVLLIEKDTPATAISLGFAYGLQRGDHDYYPMMVAASAFGEHRQFHGRLFQELRAKRGLNYGDYAYIEAFTQEGWSRFALVNTPRRQQHFSIWLRPVENANRLFALHAAVAELERLVREGLSDEEVARTKEFLAGYTMLWSATDSRRLGYALDDRFHRTVPPGHLERLRQALPTVGAKDVNAAVHRHLSGPERLRFAIVTKDAAALRDQLIAGAPAPITYATPKAPDVLEADRTITAYPLRFTADQIAIVPASRLFETARLPLP